MWHAFWLWVYYNAQTVQAACAVAGVLGLAIYAYDTRRLRLAAERQIESTIRPVIVIAIADDKKYYFVNYGPGPALNVRWTYYRIGGNEIKARTAIETGVKYDFGDSFSIIYVDPKLEVEYESTSGKRYVTSATMKEIQDGKIRLGDRLS
jgi:hypothetical protein